LSGRPRSVHHGFRRARRADQRAAWLGGAITWPWGVVPERALIGRAGPAGRGLVHAGWRRCAARAWRGWRRGEPFGWEFASAAANLAVLLLLLLAGGRGVLWTLAIAAALRIVGVAASILRTAVHTTEDAGETVLRDLGLPSRPELTELAARLEAEENTEARGPLLGLDCRRSSRFTDG
jgi:hypothetical protein